MDGCRGGFFLEGCSVRYDAGINIMEVGSTRVFDFEVGEYGVVYDLINVGSGLIVFRPDFFGEVCWFETDDGW